MKKIRTKNQLRKRAARLGCEMKYSGKLRKAFIHQIVPRKQFVPQEEPEREPEDPCYE